MSDAAGASRGNRVLRDLPTPELVQVWADGGEPQQIRALLELHTRRAGLPSDLASRIEAAMAMLVRQRQHDSAEKKRAERSLELDAWERRARKATSSRSRGSAENLLGTLLPEDLEIRPELAQIAEALLTLFSPDGPTARHVRRAFGDRLPDPQRQDELRVHLAQAQQLTNAEEAQQRARVLRDRQHDPRAACLYAERAVEIQADNRIYWNTLASCSRGAGDLPRAVAAARQSLRIESSPRVNRQGYSAAIPACIDSGHVAEAVQYADALYAEPALDTIALTVLAKAYRADGQLSRAETLLRKAAELAGGTAARDALDELRILVMTYFAVGMTDKADALDRWIKSLDVGLRATP